MKEDDRLDDAADRTLLGRSGADMTSDTRPEGERLTRRAMIEEFQTARRRHQSARSETLVRRVDGTGRPLPLVNAATHSPEDAADLLDLIRWGSDKG